MAYATKEEEAAAILNGLEEVGLVGSKLAVSKGSEARLAEQIAAHLNLPVKEWHLSFIEGQVKAAVEMSELEERLNGSMMSPAMQRMSDAVAAAAVEEKREAVEVPIEAVVVRVPPRKGTLGKSVRLKTGRLVAEEEVEGKVLATLVEELKKVNAPILAELEATMNPERATRALLSKYRASTLRRYLASGQHFRKWHESTSRLGAPMTGIRLVDYLFMREEEGMGASIPLAVSRSLGWFEGLAGVPEDEKMMNHPMVGHVVKELTKKLEEKAPPIKRAPRWPAAFFLALERLVMNASQPMGRRISAWMKLVKAWASLRFSDAANLKTGLVRYYDGQLCGLLLKSKTTGAGKRVRELPVYVGPTAHIVHREWLGVGFKLLKDSSSQEGPYVFGEGIFNRVATGLSPMKYYEAATAGGDALEDMKTLDGERMLPEGWSRFWTEHSERATLASGLAALGVAKEERDMLGRWCPEGSDQYVRTFNAVVRRLQGIFAEAARKEDAYARLDEGAIAEDLKVWLHTHWDVPQNTAEQAVENWKKKCGFGAQDGLFGPPGGLILEEEPDTEEPSPVEEEMVEIPEEGDVPVEEEPDRPIRKKQKVMPPALEVEREGDYVIVYRRAGCGTLHKLKGGCWMAKKRTFMKSEVMTEMPEPEQYSSSCRLCWPPEPTSTAGETSSEESCDDLELSDDEA